MKFFTKILLVMFCLVTIHNPLFSQASTNGLVAYYPFTSGAYDATGNGRNGSQTNGVSDAIDRYGTANRALSFDGTGYITVSNWGILTANASRSISLWFKCSSPSSTQYMLSWGTSVSSNTASRLGTYFVNAGTKKMGFLGNGEDITVDDQLQYLDNRWHHLTFTYDGTKMNLFVDALLVSTKNPFPLNTGNTNLIIGSNSSPLGSYYVGTLDEIRIYNRALTASEVQQIYLLEVATSTTTDVLKIGTDKLFHVTGTDNTFAGFRAGAFATGIGSTFIGKNTGSNNTGSNNSFFGLNAGQFNLSGASNTFMGFSSGNKNTTGSENTFSGLASGFNNTTGSRNTFSGYNSGLNMQTGNDNVFTGWFAGYSILGNNNVAIGRGAGSWATTGSGNVLMGKDAGEGSSTVANTGEFNTFIGTEAGNKNTSGSNNVFVGNRAGSGSVLNSSGSFNLYLGNLSGGFGVNGGTLQRSVAIGYNAKVSINDAIILGDTANVNLKVGIGTTRPGNSFELRSAIPNTSGLRLTNLTSNSPTLMGNSKALTVNDLGDIILVPMSGGGTNSHSDSAFVRTLVNTNFIGGNLGIGVAMPLYKLDVNGFINIPSHKSIKIDGFDFIKTSSNNYTNTIIGVDAGNVLSSTNIYNTLIGSEAGKSITAQGYNVFIGSASGRSSTSSGNVYLGVGAGRDNSTGGANVFIGNWAGISTSTGQTNTFVGQYAGNNNITGSFNVFIGNEAKGTGNNATSIQRSVAIGYNATVSINNAIVLGDFQNTNLKVGIGMHDPQFKLDVKGPINIRGINGGLGELKFMTYNFLQGDKNFNSAIGFLAEVDSQYVHSTAIGYKSYASANNVLVLGGIGENAVNVGIGNSVPKERLEITSKNDGESGLMFTNLTQKFIAKHSNSKFLSVDEKGKVGLYNLSANQITLKINNANEWSDKVFASNYQLMSINKIENFINTNGHLPNIPSAKEMTEKGVSAQDMFAKLLEKNEELMLYLLEQNKINSQQAKEIEELKKEIQKMKK